jgi:hypothetical protein
MQIITIQEAMQDLYFQLKDDLRLFGVTELTKILIRDVPTNSIPKYINILTYLEWVGKHPFVIEKKEGEEPWPDPIQKNCLIESKPR